MMFSGKIPLVFCLTVAVITTAIPQAPNRGPQNQGGSWGQGAGPGNNRGNNPGQGGNNPGHGGNNPGQGGPPANQGPPEGRPAPDGTPVWASNTTNGEDWDWPDYSIPYNPDTELCIISGPKGCPTVHVPLNFDIWQTQGDWYLYASENNFNSAGCIGCNTIQITYWQQYCEVPQFILNACCLLSCKDPSIPKNGGVTCGDTIGTGFIWPSLDDYPEWGIIKFENLGTIYTLFVIGFQNQEYFIVFGCIPYQVRGKTKLYYILRVYTRQPNPSPIVLNKINNVLNRIPETNLANFQIIGQGPGNSCIYVY